MRNVTEVIQRLIGSSEVEQSAQHFIRIVGDFEAKTESVPAQLQSSVSRVSRSVPAVAVRPE